MSSLFSYSHAEYHDKVVALNEGWLIRYAAMATMGLLDYQDSQGTRGVLFEIGVCAGRYFSVLMRSGHRSGDPVIGLDPFLWIDEATVNDRLHANVPGAPYRFINAYSTAYTARTLLDEFDGKLARFISVDGSHEASDVLWDLRLTEEILHPDGFVAVDDFFNPVAIGVNEGVHRFFNNPRALVPFAMFSNKLFLCRPHKLESFKKAIAEYAESDQSEDRPRFFIEHRNRGDKAIEQTLWGTKFYSFG